MLPKTTVFKHIPNWSGYRVNNRGVVQSCRTNQGELSEQWKVKSLLIDKDGYLKLVLHNCGKTKFIGVHSLVLQAFVRLPRFGEMALHRNGKRTDNRLENLYWGTAKDNATDRDRDGTTALGEKNGNCKLSSAEVKQIKNIRDKIGLSYGKIAQQFNVSKRQVMRICKGQGWLSLAQNTDAPREVPIARIENGEAVKPIEPAGTFSEMPIT